MQKLAARRRVFAVRDALNYEQAEFPRVHLLQALWGFLQTGRRLVGGQHAVEVTCSAARNRPVFFFIRTIWLAARRMVAWSWPQRLALRGLVCLHMSCIYVQSICVSLAERRMHYRNDEAHKRKR